jgi:hypothetical protein
LLHCKRQTAVAGDSPIGGGLSFTTPRDESIVEVLSNLGAAPDELSRAAYT